MISYKTGRLQGSIANDMKALKDVEYNTLTEDLKKKFDYLNQVGDSF